METVDEEFLGAALDFMDRQNKAKKPFFVWFNPSRMHYHTHVPPERQVQPELLRRRHVAA